MNTCTDPNCRNDSFRTGLCEAHYELARIARKRELAAQRRATRDYDASQQGAMIQRNLNAMTKRAETGDDSALIELVALEEYVHEATQRAVDRMRTTEGGAFSWTEIANLIGLGSPQAAQQRFGRRRRSQTPAPEAARRVGGQPGHLR